MRIGIVTHNYPLNNSDRKDAGIFLYDFAHELSKKHDVYVLAPNFAGKKQVDKHVPVTWFKWKGGDKKLGNISLLSLKGIFQNISLLWSGTRATYAFTKDNKIDIVVAAWAFPAGFFAYISSVFTEVPYVTWSLGSDINIYAQYPLVKQMITLILRRAKRRFANSLALSGRVSSLSHKKCIFLPAVTNINTHVSSKSHKSSIFTFLFIGRLENVKGVDILIDAVSLLPRNKKWRVLIGGDGTRASMLQNQVKMHNLSQRVKFLGRLDEDEVPQYMAQSNFLVVPSRSESLPLVMIEAAKMSLPSIVSNVGDCKRLIKRYKTGEFFEKENAPELAQKMNKVLKARKSTYKKGLQQLAADFTQDKAISIFTTYAK